MEISERDRLILFGCDDGSHETIVIDYGDHKSTICERCGMHWPYDKAARQTRLRWNTQRLQSQIARDIDEAQRLAKSVQRVDG
jgi:ribosomal protein S26